MAVASPAPLLSLKFFSSCEEIQTWLAKSDQCLSVLICGEIQESATIRFITIISGKVLLLRGACRNEHMRFACPSWRDGATLNLT